MGHALGGAPGGGGARLGGQVGMLQGLPVLASVQTCPRWRMLPGHSCTSCETIN